MHWLSLAPTSAGVCDIISVAWWKGTRAGVSACFECLLWRWSECRHTDGEGKTSLKLPSLPKSLPSCQIQCCVKVPGPVAGSKKNLSMLKGSREKTWTRSLQFKWKYYLCKQTGFPPVVTHLCHLFLPVTSHTAAFDPSHTAPPTAVLVVLEPFPEWTTRIRMYHIDSRLIYECYMRRLTSWSLSYIKHFIIPMTVLLCLQNGNQSSFKFQPQDLKGF